jgi:hypothetical protein
MKGEVVRIGVATIALDTVQHYLQLFTREWTRLAAREHLIGEGQDKQVAFKGKSNCDVALDDKDPPPASNAVGAVELHQDIG